MEGCGVVRLLGLGLELWQVAASLGPDSVSAGRLRRRVVASEGGRT